MGALALLLPGCTAEKAEPPQPVELKVVILPYISFAPYFIAAEEGFFEEQGLKVEFVKSTPAPRPCRPWPGAIWMCPTEG
jgi:ABC-type nitrate/sulfonate/bicarbonate transport system substrate-binding protein